jgi:hypothetical protein
MCQVLREPPIAQFLKHRCGFADGQSGLVESRHDREDWLNLESAATGVSVDGVVPS